ncbi:sugar phosphate isomerase/epimerase [Candidatus Bathyarchaeota archaeon]|nr:sugar phosphate isomerase/epimerase [Candidatus Bathyarchaeota archaeon]
MKITIMTRVYWKCYTAKSLNVSLYPIIRRVAASGYDAIDFCEHVDEFWPLGLTQDDRKTIRDLLNSVGLEVSSLTTPTAWPLPAGITVLSQLKRSIEIASYFGAKVVMCGSAPKGEEEWRKTVDLYQEVGSHAEDHGIDIAIEFMNIGYPTTESILKFLDEVGIENVGVCLEVENVNARPKNEPLKDHMTKVKEKIKLIHLVDPTNEEMHKKMNINVSEVVETVKKFGFDGYLVNEAITRQIPYEKLDAEVCRSAKFLKNIITKSSHSNISQKKACI